MLHTVILFLSPLPLHPSSKKPSCDGEEFVRGSSVNLGNKCPTKRRDWGATDPLRPSGKGKYFKVGNQEQDNGEKRKSRRGEWDRKLIVFFLYSALKFRCISSAILDVLHVPCSRLTPEKVHHTSGLLILRSVSPAQPLQLGFSRPDSIANSPLMFQEHHKLNRFKLRPLYFTPTAPPLVFQIVGSNHVIQDQVLTVFWNFTFSLLS